MIVKVIDHQEDMEFSFSGSKEVLVEQIVQEFDLLSLEQLETVINQGYIERNHVSAFLIKE
jgi:hypothetical protein